MEISIFLSPFIKCTGAGKKPEAVSSYHTTETIQKGRENHNKNAMKDKKKLSSSFFAPML